jgi:hypothetical protein
MCKQAYRFAEMPLYESEHFLDDVEELNWEDGWEKSKFMGPVTVQCTALERMNLLLYAKTAPILRYEVGQVG